MYESPSDGYVFTHRADGKLEFKGDFEGLYQSDPDPWGQSGGHPRLKEYYVYSRSILALALDRLPRWDAALEVGCGTGHVTNLLSHYFLDKWVEGGPQVEGMDISATAIARAMAAFPGILFHVADIGAPGVGDRFHQQFDVVVLNQTLWYVLHLLGNTCRNVLKTLKHHGVFVIQMAFLDRQEYGREIVDGFNGLLRYVLDHHAADFQVVSASYDASSRYAPYHDGLLVLQSTR